MDMRRFLANTSLVEIPQAVLEKWTRANIATQKDTQYTQALAVLMQRISRLK